MSGLMTRSQPRMLQISCRTELDSADLAATFPSRKMAWAVICSPSPGPPNRSTWNPNSASRERASDTYRSVGQSFARLAVPNANPTTVAPAEAEKKVLAADSSSSDRVISHASGVGLSTPTTSRNSKNRSCVCRQSPPAVYLVLTSRTPSRVLEGAKPTRTGAPER